MAKRLLLGRLLLALTGVLVAWGLFTAGYYLAFTRAEKEKIALVRGDIKLMKYAVEEIRKNNSVRAIESLQGMAEVKEAYIKAAYQVLNDIMIFSFTVHPGQTIYLIFSDPRFFEKQTAAPPPAPAPR